jgi:transposase
MTKDVRCEIGIIPAQAKVTKHVVQIYSCRNCEKNADAVPIIKAPSPPALIKGSIASASAVAYIIHGKYVMANPLYLQEADFKKLGINLSRQTMSNWLIRVSQDYLSLLYDLLHESLTSREICHIDETVIEVIKEPGRTAQQGSYMWLYRTGETDERPIVLFDYQQSRAGDCPKAFMKGFSGYYHTDGYLGYNKMVPDKNEKPPPRRIRVGCWSHSRRPYDEALRGLKKEQVKAITYSEKGLEYCNKLFEFERKWKGLSPDERLKKRKEFAAPVVDKYFEWCKAVSKFAAGLLAKAVNYSIGQEEYLRNYLLDGRLSISNNAAREISEALL